MEIVQWIYPQWDRWSWLQYIQVYYWSFIHFVWLIFPSTKIWRARNSAPQSRKHSLCLQVNLLEKLQHKIRLHGLKESARSHKKQNNFFPIQVLSNSRARKFQQLSKILCEPCEILWNWHVHLFYKCAFQYLSTKNTHPDLIYYSWQTLSQVFIYFCSLHCRHGGHPGQDTDHHILSGHPEN